MIHVRNDSVPATVASKGRIVVVVAAAVVETVTATVTVVDDASVVVLPGTPGADVALTPAAAAAAAAASGAAATVVGTAIGRGARVCDALSDAEQADDTDIDRARQVTATRLDPTRMTTMVPARHITTDSAPAAGRRS